MSKDSIKVKRKKRHIQAITHLSANRPTWSHNTLHANVSHTCHLILVHKTLTSGCAMPYLAAILFIWVWHNLLSTNNNLLLLTVIFFQTTCDTG